MGFHVIKENDLFYLSNEDGLIPGPFDNTFGYGLFRQDTRVLSKLTWTVGPSCMLTLAADSSQNYEAVYRYTNAQFTTTKGADIQAQSLLLTRRQSTDGHTFVERGHVENFTDSPLQFSIQYELDADFADMFEVRGFSADIGNRSVNRSVVSDNRICFSYLAEDGLQCRTFVQSFGGDDVTVANMVNEERALVKVYAEVPARGKSHWGIQVLSELQPDDHALTRSVNPMAQTGAPNLNNSENTLIEDGTTLGVADSYHKWFVGAPTVSGHKVFQTWYERGLKDLRMLITDIGYGEFPTAGVPWFAVPFGRDSLITSLQMMMANPTIAKGTLETMAAFQGTQNDPSRDEQPGKIMHELRVGELTRTKRVPFDPYFGTIDATPLFLNLAADYFEWTGDRELIEKLMPVAEKAFNWIETYGDRDGDGFVEYQREAEGGIANQGWKDSGDSVTHADGQMAHGSIALCEVQGYVYRAYSKWSSIMEYFGNYSAAKEFERKAVTLRERFLKSFWLEEASFIAMALDGDKKPVQTVTSNMGQVLWSGILPDEHANKVVDRLLESDMDCGFGIRTLSSAEVVYNPISYHNGSVWPHDNSILIAGMAAYGRFDAVHTVSEGLLRASEGFELYRLPELFAGISSSEVQTPVPYPVSCSPQAWAAATPIFVLQSLLGLRPRVTKREIHLSPSLLQSMKELVVEGIPVGGGHISVKIRALADGTVESVVTENSTGLKVVCSTPEVVL